MVGKGKENGLCWSGMNPNVSLVTKVVTADGLAAMDGATTTDGVTNEDGDVSAVGVAVKFRV